MLAGRRWRTLGAGAGKHDAGAGGGDGGGLAEAGMTRGGV